MLKCMRLRTELLDKYCIIQVHDREPLSAVGMLHKIRHVQSAQTPFFFESYVASRDRLGYKYYILPINSGGVSVQINFQVVLCALLV